MPRTAILMQCAISLFCFSAALVNNRNWNYKSRCLQKCSRQSMGIMGGGFNSNSRNKLTKNFASVASISESVTDRTKAETPNPVYSMVSFMKVLWDFTRPHTIVGSGISVLALYAFGTPPQLWGTSKFIASLWSCLLPALLMNIYITGLNQVTDIEIDKINKPYLPIAAGELSKEHGITVVIASLISSMYLVRNAEWPLQAVVLGSGVLGTLYSLPPFRLKRYPALAAFCILIVRGSLVNMGFFLQAKTQMLGEVLPSFGAACRRFPESVLLTSFFAVFGIVIALMKDVPDVKGDKMNSISSFSVKLGAKKMFSTAWRLLVALLVGSASTCVGTLFIPQLKAITPLATKTVVTCRLALSAILGLFAVDVTTRAEKVDITKPDRIFSYYMHIWNIFYACYFLLPLVR